MKGLERPACRENLATKTRYFTHAYILPVSDFCQSEIKFGVHWPRTKTGEEVTVECSLVDSNLTGIIATCINRPLSLYRWRYTWFFTSLLHCHHPFCRMYSKPYYFFTLYHSINFNAVIHIVIV